MKTLPGGLGGVPGFTSLGKHVGIKKTGKDFALLVADRPCAAAAVYTQNQVKGAPLIVTKEHLANRRAQAVAVNSGIANVATGVPGIQNARATARAVAEELGIAAADVLVASTGVIGPQLPFDKIAAGVKGAKRQLGTGSDFAEAIMTTDTFPKEICVEHGGFRLAGAAKGAGMIAPNMATMLAFIVTDAAVGGAELEAMLKRSVARSFNMLSVDMDTSTSDMAVILASGRVQSVDRDDFQAALDFVCVELAKQLARDGEGTTKLIVSDVRHAASAADARQLARAIVASNLVKCAVYGNDPNWGRLMMALGNSGASTFTEDLISITINGQPIVSGGQAAPDFDEQELSANLASSKEVTIAIDMGVGDHGATAYGCDMSEEYVKINAEYTT